MDVGFPILMLIFAAALLLYAALIRASKSTELIWKWEFAKIPDKEAYAKQFSKALAIVALAPAACGVLGLLGHTGLGVVVLIIGTILGLVNAVRLIKKVI